MDKLKKRGRMDQSAEEKALEQAEFLASCTVSFNGFAYPPAKGLEGAAYFRKALAMSASCPPACRTLPSPGRPRT